MQQASSIRRVRHTQYFSISAGILLQQASSVSCSQPHPHQTPPDTCPYGDESAERTCSCSRAQDALRYGGHLCLPLALRRLCCIPACLRLGPLCGQALSLAGPVSGYALSLAGRLVRQRSTPQPSTSRPASGVC